MMIKARALTILVLHPLNMRAQKLKKHCCKLLFTNGNKYYDYDNIGNLLKDKSEGITGIEWNVYGKIKQIVKNGATISCQYDASGNRVMKQVGNKRDFYIRDAQGNVMAIYKDQGSYVDWTEQHLYGSSRLGIWNYGKKTPDAPGAVVYDSMMVGSVNYELSNHLGNVLSTISDKKIGVSAGKTVVDYYSAVVTTQNDYYPFGMQMPGRGGSLTAGGWVNGTGGASLLANLTVSSRTGNEPKEYKASKSIEFIAGFSSGTNDEFSAYIDESAPSGGGSGDLDGNDLYRYGFNGIEKVNEIADVGNHYSALFGEYDPRVVYRWNLDPKPNPSMSPYSIFAGNPIWHSDPLLDTIIVNNKGGITRNDKTDKLVFMADKNGKLTSLGELGKKVDANTIYKNLAKDNAKEAKAILNPLTFYNNVKTGGDWDLKSDKDNIFGLANILANKGGIDQTQFLFQGKNMEAQDVGNHHFGVVGKAYGLFSEEYMLRQAGEYQIKSGTSKPEWRPVIKVEKDMYIEHGMKVKTTEIIKLPPYGDDPRDQEWIKAGFQYYKDLKK